MATTLKLNNYKDKILGVPVEETTIEMYLTAADGNIVIVPWILPRGSILRIELPDAITCATDEIQIGPGEEIANWPDMLDELA